MSHSISVFSESSDVYAPISSDYLITKVVSLEHYHIEEGSVFGTIYHDDIAIQKFTVDVFGYITLIDLVDSKVKVAEVDIHWIAGYLVFKWNAKCLGRHYFIISYRFWWYDKMPKFETVNWTKEGF